MALLFFDYLTQTKLSLAAKHVACGIFVAGILTQCRPGSHSLFRPTAHRHGLASAGRIDSRVGDRSAHRTEILPLDLAQSGRRQTGQVVC